MTRRRAVLALLVCLALGQQPTPRDLVTQIQGLLEQLQTALQPPIATPAAFDAAYAAAAPGAVLTLAPTLVYPTALVLTKPITLQAAGLPTPAVRIDLATPLPSFRDGITIRSADVALVGLEVRKRDPLTDIVTLTGARVTLDRVRVLGDPTRGAKRGIAANGGGDVVLIRYYVEDCFQAFPGNDSQAIIAWDMAPGLVIEDGYASGGSESIMLGGADAGTPERMPSNVVIRGNTITKRPAWQGLPIGVKNTLELKAARHVFIENNDISGSWGGHGQDGYLLLMTVRNQDGRAPWSTIQDVTVTGNRFSRGAGAINLLGLDNIKESKPNLPTPIGTARPSVRMARITIRGNSFTDVDPVTYTGSNRLILIGAGPETVLIDANTFAGAHLGAQVYLYGAPPALGLTITGNTWPPSTYGVKGDGQASGAATWLTYTTAGLLAGNVVK